MFIFKIKDTVQEEAMHTPEVERKGLINLAHNLSAVLLLMFPKCSLCLFAVSSSIAVCGLKPIITPLWEYVLVLFFSCIPLSIMLLEMKKQLLLIPLLVMVLGLLLVMAFLFLSLNNLLYYAGAILLSLSLILLRMQKAISCRTQNM